MKIATIDMVADADTLSNEARNRLGVYLSGFLEPQFKHENNDVPNAIVCPCCRSHIYCGDLKDALFSTFQWGIAHGDGFCGKCGWPIRMFHFIKLDGENEQRLVFPLAYRQYDRDENEISPDALNEKRMAE